MKNLLIIALALLAFTFVSCGGDNCQTCTMEGADSEEICEGDGIGSGIAFTAEITAKELEGFDCN